MISVLVENREQERSDDENDFHQNKIMYSKGRCFYKYKIPLMQQKHSCHQFTILLKIYDLLHHLQSSCAYTGYRETYLYNHLFCQKQIVAKWVDFRSKTALFSEVIFINRDLVSL